METVKYTQKYHDSHTPITWLQQLASCQSCFLSSTEFSVFLEAFYFIFVLFKLCRVVCRILVPWPGMDPEPPSIGSAEFQPLDYQGSPVLEYFKAVADIMVAYL